MGQSSRHPSATLDPLLLTTTSPQSSSRFLAICQNNTIQLRCAPSSDSSQPQLPFDQVLLETPPIAPQCMLTGIAPIPLLLSESVELSDETNIPISIPTVVAVSGGDGKVRLVDFLRFTRRRAGRGGRGVGGGESNGVIATVGDIRGFVRCVESIGSRTSLSEEATFVFGGRDGVAYLWNVKKSDDARGMPSVEVTNVDDVKNEDFESGRSRGGTPIESLRCVGSGERLLVGKFNGWVYVWDLPHRQEIGRIETHEGLEGAAAAAWKVGGVDALDAPGSLIATASKETVRCWDPRLMSLSCAFEKADEMLYSMFWSRGREHCLVAGGFSSIHIYDVRNPSAGEVLRCPVEGHEVFGLTEIGSEGEMFGVSCGSERAGVWRYDGKKVCWDTLNGQSSSLCSL